MANTTITDRTRRGKLLDKTGAQITGSYQSGPQFIGGGAAKHSFWVKVTLDGANSITLKLEGAAADQASLTPLGWASIGTRRHSTNPTVENAEHAFAADGVYLLTSDHAGRVADKITADAGGNTGGLRFSYKADGTVGSNTKVEVLGTFW